MDESGQFHFIELKHLSGNRMTLRPAQVAWLDRHKKGSVWVLARQDIKRTATWQICLYKGSSAVDLALEKLSDVEPACQIDDPKDWPKLLEEIFS